MPIPSPSTPLQGQTKPGAMAGMQPGIPPPQTAPTGGQSPAGMKLTGGGAPFIDRPAFAHYSLGQQPGNSYSAKPHGAFATVDGILAAKANLAKQAKAAGLIGKRAYEEGQRREPEHARQEYDKLTGNIMAGSAGVGAGLGGILGHQVGAEAGGDMKSQLLGALLGGASGALGGGGLGWLGGRIFRGPPPHLGQRVLHDAIPAVDAMTGYGKQAALAALFQPVAKRVQPPPQSLQQLPQPDLGGKGPPPGSGADVPIKRG